MNYLHYYAKMQNYAYHGQIIRNLMLADFVYETDTRTTSTSLFLVFHFPSFFPTSSSSSTQLGGEEGITTKLVIISQECQRASYCRKDEGAEQQRLKLALLNRGEAPQGKAAPSPLVLVECLSVFICLRLHLSYPASLSLPLLFLPSSPQFVPSPVT